MIPNLINPIPCVTAALGLIGIGGFPHSEIAGSKLAHSSPALIAACHVLHRLYMPRHPRIALTSRLRVHTTNNNTGSPLQVTRNSAEQCPVVLPGRIIALQRLCSLPGADNIISARLCEMNRLVSQPAPALRLPRSTQSRYLHGIDFKNPFTMSKRSVSLPKPPRRRGGTVSLHQTGYRSGWWSLSGSNR